MSNELVPLDYQRYAYNAHHGTELQHHNSLLTAEQAAQVNNNYDIELYFGTHGAVPGADTEATHNPLVLPSQKEYEEAAAVVDSLQPGDTLFVENYGFTKPTLEPLPPIPSAEELGSLGSSRFFSSHAEMFMRDMRQSARDQLENARQNYKISALDYARQLAALKGIRTVYADLDAFDKQRVTTLNEGNDSFGLLIDPEPKNRELQKSTGARRELQVPNVVKDWALKHLPEAEAQNARGRKPKLAVLFGRNHEEPTEQAFTGMGLETRTVVLDSSSDKERGREQLGRVAREAALKLYLSTVSAVAGALATNPSTSLGVRARTSKDATVHSHVSSRLSGSKTGFGRIDPRRLGTVDPERYKFHESDLVGLARVARNRRNRSPRQDDR